MEEGVLRLRSSNPFLYVIDYQDINRLIEIDKVVGSVLSNRVGVLHLKEASRDI